MAFHPKTRHPQAVTPGGTGATLRPGVCLGGARIRVPSLGKLGIPPETSNSYCLPGRAGGTPNVLARSHQAGATYSPSRQTGRRPTADAYRLSASSDDRIEEVRPRT